MFFWEKLFCSGGPRHPLLVYQFMAAKLGNIDFPTSKFLRKHSTPFPGMMPTRQKRPTSLLPVFYYFWYFKVVKSYNTRLRLYVIFNSSRSGEIRFSGGPRPWSSSPFFPPDRMGAWIVSSFIGDLYLPFGGEESEQRILFSPPAVTQFWGGAPPPPRLKRVRVFFTHYW